jgi:hypothetical protein
MLAIDRVSEYADFLSVSPMTFKSMRDRRHGHRQASFHDDRSEKASTSLLEIRVVGAAAPARDLARRTRPGTTRRKDKKHG